MQEITIQNPNKRVNVISKEVTDGNGVIIQQGGILMRTTRSLAYRLINAGTHSTTSKGKLKSFLNKNGKLHRNNQTLLTLMKSVSSKTDKKVVPDLSEINWKELKKAGHEPFNDPYNGKSYLAIKKKEVEVTMFNPKEIDPMTGKPKEFKVNQPRYQMIVLSFPNY